MTSNQSKIIITLLDSSSDNDQDEERGQEIEEIGNKVEELSEVISFSDSNTIKSSRVSIETVQSSLASSTTSSLEFTTPPALNTRARKKNSANSKPSTSSSSSSTESLPLNSDSSLSEEITPTNKRKKSTPSPRQKIPKLRLDIPANESQPCPSNASEQKQEIETTSGEEKKANKEVPCESNDNENKNVKDQAEKEDKDEDDLDCSLPDMDTPVSYFTTPSDYLYFNPFSNQHTSFPNRHLFNQGGFGSIIYKRPYISNDWKKIILGPNDDKESSSISDLEEDELERKPLKELQGRSFNEKSITQSSANSGMSLVTSSLDSLPDKAPNSATSTDAPMDHQDDASMDSTNVDIFSLFSQPTPSSFPTVPSVKINTSQISSFTSPYSSNINSPSSQALPTNSKFSIPSSPLSSPLLSPTRSITTPHPDSEPHSPFPTANKSTLSPPSPSASTLTTNLVSSSSSSPVQSLNHKHSSSLSTTMEYLPTTVSFMLHSSSPQTPSELMGEFELQADEPFDIGLGKCLETFPLDSSALVLAYKNTKISKYCTPKIMGFQVYVILDVFRSETDFSNFQSAFSSSTTAKGKPEQEETVPMLHLTLSDPSKNTLKLKILPTKLISDVIQAFRKKFNLSYSIHLFGPDGDKLDPTLSCEELGLEDEDLLYVKKQMT